MSQITNVIRASLTGPILAAVSQAAASTCEDFDGLIYGGLPAVPDTLMHLFGHDAHWGFLISGTYWQHLERSMGDERGILPTLALLAHQDLQCKICKGIASLQCSSGSVRNLGLLLYYMPRMSFAMAKF